MSFLFETLPQSGDVKLKVVADSKAELFQGALEGMIDILKPEIEEGSFKIIKLEIQAADLANLLVDFLNFVLAQMGIHRVAFSTISIQFLTDQELRAELSGLPYQRVEEEIKAATYYGVKAEKNNQGQWEAVVVFDI